MWPVYQAAIRDLFESKLSDEEAQIMGHALRRILDAARSAEADADQPVEQVARRKLATKR
jgi:hypothetical protein